MSGLVTVENTGSLALSGTANIFLNGGPFRLSGNATMNFTGAGALQMSGPGVLNIDPGVTFDIQSDNGIGATGGIINNAGTFRKSAGTGNTIVSCTMNNSGLVDAQSGTLTFNGGGAQTGVFNTAVGTTIGFTSANFSWDNGADFNGSGTILQSGGLINVTAAVNAQNFTFTAGTLSVSPTKTLSIDGSFNWNAGGQTSGGGTIAVTNTGSLSLGGAANLFLNSLTLSLSGNGTMNFTGAGALQIGGGGILVIQPGVTFDILTDNGIGTTGGNINNAGSLRKTGGSGTSTISCALNNSGLVDVQTGTLAFIGGGTQTGTFNTQTGTTISFNSALFNTGTTFTGTGTALQNGGTTNFNAMITMQNFTFTGGTLGVSGVVTINGTFAWNGGGQTSGIGSIIVSAAGSMALSGTANLFLNNI
jgi:hypothetical protein